MMFLGALWTQQDGAPGANGNIYSRQFSRSMYHENGTSSSALCNRGHILSGKLTNTMRCHIFQASNRSSNDARDRSRS